MAFPLESPVCSTKWASFAVGMSPRDQSILSKLDSGIEGFETFASLMVRLERRGRDVSDFVDQQQTGPWFFWDNSSSNDLCFEEAMRIVAFAISKTMILQQMAYTPPSAPGHKDTVKAAFETAHGAVSVLTNSEFVKCASTIPYINRYLQIDTLRNLSDGIVYMNVLARQRHFCSPSTRLCDSLSDKTTGSKYVRADLALAYCEWLLNYKAVTDLQEWVHGLTEVYANWAKAEVLRRQELTRASAGVQCCLCYMNRAINMLTKLRYPKKNGLKSYIQTLRLRLTQRNAAIWDFTYSHATLEHHLIVDPTKLPPGHTCANVSSRLGDKFVSGIVTDTIKSVPEFTYDRYAAESSVGFEF